MKYFFRSDIRTCKCYSYSLFMYFIDLLLVTFNTLKRISKNLNKLLKRKPFFVKQNTFHPFLQKLTWQRLQMEVVSKPVWSKSIYIAKGNVLKIINFFMNGIFEWDVDLVRSKCKDKRYMAKY